MVQSLAQLGLDAIHNPSATIFWSAVMGGWIIATVAGVGYRISTQPEIGREDGDCG